MSINGLELAKNMLRWNVIQPLNVYEQMTDMMAKVVGENDSGVLKLRDEQTWKHFVPPLMNYAVTALEVFLEHYFLENYVTSNGQVYNSKKELGDDIKEFCTRHKIDKLSKNISFQRMYDVVVLYRAGLKKDIESFPDYELIMLQFAKRHLFQQFPEWDETKPRPMAAW